MNLITQKHGELSPEEIQNILNELFIRHKVKKITYEVSNIGNTHKFYLP